MGQEHQLRSDQAQDQPLRVGRAKLLPDRAETDVTQQAYQDDQPDDHQDHHDDVGPPPTWLAARL